MRVVDKDSRIGESAWELVRVHKWELKVDGSFSEIMLWEGTGVDGDFQRPKLMKALDHGWELTGRMTIDEMHENWSVNPRVDMINWSTRAWLLTLCVFQMKLKKVARLSFDEFKQNKTKQEQRTSIFFYNSWFQLKPSLRIFLCKVRTSVVLFANRKSTKAVWLIDVTMA